MRLEAVGDQPSTPSRKDFEAPVTLSHPTTERRHWLVDVAHHAGLYDLKLQANAPFTQIRAAWAEIARASGISEEALAERVAQHFRLTVADLGAVEHQTAKLIPEKTARKHGVLPLQASDQMLVVATSDPLSIEAEQEIQFLSGRQAVFQVAAPGPLLEAIERAYSREKIVDFVLQTLAAEAASEDVLIVKDRSADVAAVEGPQPTHSIANLVHRVLGRAIESGASAVLVGPSNDSGHVRFRIDGVAEHFMHLPTPALVRMIRRIKELARLNPDVRGQPQEGRFRATVGGQAYRMHVTTEPAGSLDRASIRITRPEGHPSLAELPLTPDEHIALARLTDGRGGLVLVAVPDGATGSYVLRSLTKTLGSAGAKVVSLETSIDYDLEGVKSVLVDPAGGLGFREALAAALEGGPDVVALSDFTDASAAGLAVEAAQRGTLVLAVCRGEDAISGVARLTTLGLDRGRIAASLRAVIAERLLRRICGDCGKSVRAPDDVPMGERALSEAYGLQPNRVPVGCDACRGTGFRGRVPILEIIPFEGRLAEMIGAGALLSDLKNTARTMGLPDLRDIGMRRVLAGETSIQEVERVLGRSLSKEGGSATRVLVVDDSAADRLLMKTLLEQHGFSVTEAPNGAAALKLLEVSSGVSVVLLDLLMPEMDGRETLGRLRSSVRTAGIPVVILTASDDPDLELQLLEAGADDYLGKPVDPARLVARVRSVIRRSAWPTESAMV